MPLFIFASCFSLKSGSVNCSVVNSLLFRNFGFFSRPVLSVSLILYGIILAYWGIFDPQGTQTAFLLDVVPHLRTLAWLVQGKENPSDVENLLGVFEEMPRIIQILLGVGFIAPRLEENKAKVADIDVIVIEVLRTLAKGILKGKKVNVIYGNTMEAIDDVRYITNASTGITGAEIARRAYIEGAEVNVWRSKSSIKPCAPIDEMLFENHSDLVTKSSELSGDLTIVPAAISDFGLTPIDGKIPSKDPQKLELFPLPKVIDSIKGPLVVFKAVSGKDDNELIAKARAMLSENVLLVVGNDIRNVGQPGGRYLFVTRKGEDTFEGTKIEMAKELVRRANECLEE